MHWGIGVVPADVFLPDGFLADRTVQDAVERLQKVMVGVDLVQVDRDCADTYGKDEADAQTDSSTKMLK